MLVLGAYKQNELLGIIRVVGDGATIIFIQDILVFPEYQRNSEKWDELKSHRLEYAISMFRKGKITASLAAQVAGMNYYDFEDYLRKIGIRWKS